MLEDTEDKEQNTGSEWPEKMPFWQSAVMFGITFAAVAYAHFKILPPPDPSAHKPQVHTPCLVGKADCHICNTARCQSESQSYCCYNDHI